MIDKRIFYCWFGDGEMSELNKKCMETWKQLCPDYEIVKISEDNYDYNSNPYAKEGYKNKDWSAVTNAARLEFLKHNSGFYLDTDVRLTKSLDEMRIYDGGFITEFESGQPDSGILGCGSDGCKFYNETLKNLVPGTVLHKEFIKLLYKKYDVHGESIRTYDDGFTVLGDEYFPTVRTGLFTENTIGIHYFENTWANVKRNITDGFYPFPKMRVFIGNQMIHEDSGLEVNFRIKNIQKRWDAPDMLGKTNYFFNPKVVKLFCKDFEAERINYDKQKTQQSIVTRSGLIVSYI